MLLWGLTALALALRTAAVLRHQQLGWELRFDPGMYLTLAENLGHGVYSMFHPLDIPDTIKRPGYPALIHLLGNRITATLLFQSLLSALKVPLVFLLGRAIGLRNRYALLAAGAMAIEPMDVLLSAQLLTEAVFGFLVLAGTLLLVKGRSWPGLLCAALLFGLSAWVRPNGISLALMAGAGAFVLLRHGTARSAAFVGVAVLCVLPWALHNQRVLGRFYLGDSGVVAAGYYQVPDVLRAVGDERGSRMHRELNDRAASTDWTDDTAYHAFFDDLRADVRATFTAHPFVWLRVQAVKAARITVAPGRGHIALFFGNHGAVRTLVLGVSLGFSAVVLFALVVPLIQWRRAPGGVRLLPIMAAGLIAMGALTTSDARFKNPGMALLIVAAAWGVQRLAGRPSGGDHRPDPSSNNPSASWRTRSATSSNHFVPPSGPNTKGANARTGG